MAKASQAAAAKPRTKPQAGKVPSAAHQSKQAADHQKQRITILALIFAALSLVFAGLTTYWYS